MKKCSVCKIKKSLDSFSVDKSKKSNRRTNCRKCDSLRKTRYLSTEQGFLKSIYSNMVCRKKYNKMSKVYRVEFTYEQLIKKWEDHKLKYGQNCIYTNEPIFHKRNKKLIRGNQISIDRIDNNKHYTLDNIVFCSSKANWVKGHITINLCKKILQVYNETQS